MKRTQRSELLMGVMIGFYGNWLIQLLDKIKIENMFSQIMLLSSFAPLFIYFWIAYTNIEDQIVFNLITIKGAMGFIHFILIISSTALSSILVEEYIFILPGIFFWLSLLIVEMKGLISKKL